MNFLKKIEIMKMKNKMFKMEMRMKNNMFEKKMHTKIKMAIYTDV